MNKFKGFLTALAFIWLGSCGFWAIFRCFTTGEVAWLGLLINAWALPLWMLLRYMQPGKYRGDQREPPAFAAVLVGLAVALLTDSEKSQPVYLAIYNLLIFLVYLFHLSSLHHPDAARVDSRFPVLETADGKSWSAEEYSRRNNFRGLLLVFLRGSFCADSRSLLAQLPDLMPEMHKRGLGLVLFGVEAPSRWPRSLRESLPVDMLQLAAGKGANGPFVAPGGAPLLLRPRQSDTARPSQWLLDSEGFVLWRHLPANYRTLGNVEMLRGQLFRLED